LDRLSLVGSQFEQNMDEQRPTAANAIEIRIDFFRLIGWSTPKQLCLGALDDLIVLSAWELLTVP